MDDLPITVTIRMQPLMFLLPMLSAFFLWWFTTGLIMAVYGRSPRTVRLYFVGATGVMLLALAGLVATRHLTNIGGVYLAISCGVLVWGWHMASYYLGFVTGRLPLALPAKPSWRAAPTLGQRFRLALQASLDHELLVLGFGLLLAVLTWSAANRWGFWTFLTLWLMHTSAKLNVFFGVRNFRMEFLPAHLHTLGKLLSKRPISEFFPFSVGIASSVGALLLYRGFAGDAAVTDATGMLLVGTMILLGVLEHWLLVLPVPLTLWGWGVRPLPEPTVLEEEAATRQTTTTIRAMREQVSEG